MFFVLHGHGVLALAALYQGYLFRKALLSEAGSGARKQAWRLTALMALLFMSGVVLYISYRARGGVRSFLMDHHPLWHTVGFEWKEAVGYFGLLLTLALAAAATRAPLQLGDRRRSMALLAALLATMLVATGIGTYLSFFVKAVA